MAIKNFLFFLKLIRWVLGLVVLVSVGCQMKTVKRSGEPAVAGSPEAGTTPSTATNSDSAASVPTQQRQSGQLGLILGPGAVRAFAEVGFLQEVLKAQIPIRGIVGFEMGAFVGALTAARAQTFEPEWQLMKMKDSDWVNRSVLGREVQAQGLGPVISFLEQNYSGLRTEDMRIPFACPAHQLRGRQSYLLHKGALRDVLPNCMAFPPLWKAHQGSVADFSAMDQAVQFLKSKGATHIVFVSVIDEKTAIPSRDETMRILWSSWMNQIERRRSEIVEVVRLSNAVQLDEIEKKEDLVRRGKEIGQEWAQAWLRKEQM